MRAERSLPGCAASGPLAGRFCVELPRHTHARAHTHTHTGTLTHSLTHTQRYRSTLSAAQEAGLDAAVALLQQPQSVRESVAPWLASPQTSTSAASTPAKRFAHEQGSFSANQSPASAALGTPVQSEGDVCACVALIAFVSVPESVRSLCWLIAFVCLWHDFPCRLASAIYLSAERRRRICLCCVDCSPLPVPS